MYAIVVNQLAERERRSEPMQIGFTKGWETTYRGDLALHVSGSIQLIGCLTAISRVGDDYLWELENVVEIDPVPCRAKPGIWPVDIKRETPDVYDTLYA